MKRSLAEQPTAGLILAAGLGSRFGGRKLQTRIDGKPMLQHVLDLAAVAELDSVVVVLGTDTEELRKACTWRDEMIAFNETPEAGLATSVRLGLAALTATQAMRCVVLLGDQPYLSAQQLAVITEPSGDIVVPRFDGQPGNPVLLDRSIWPLASQLEGDRGFVQLFATHPELVRYVDVPGTNPDIDTPTDLETLSRA